jgi:tRNA U34 2-thiouridine synthase MnmA/TrmU
MKAIALISGGLDSLLAAKLIAKQGIEVVGLRFKIPFYLNSRKTLSNLGIEIKEVDIGDEFLKLVVKPRYGYGANINPCIDCKILMLTKAKEFMEQFSASFVITGEVLGQRPMSQHRQALELIEKNSGLEGLLLRPLSGRLLPETIPEKEGWVNRNNLLDFNGRSRKSQMVLAKTFGIKEYAQPAGGCLLTDLEFAKRLKDLITHQELDMNSVELLKVGRHFRISRTTKLIVGRNELENERIVNLAQGDDYLFMPAENTAGPTALGRGIFNEDLIKLSCGITCRYCDLDGKISLDIVYSKMPKKEDKILKVSAIDDSRLVSLRI